MRCRIKAVQVEKLTIDDNGTCAFFTSAGNATLLRAMRTVAKRANLQWPPLADSQAIVTESTMIVAEVS